MRTVRTMELDLSHCVPLGGDVLVGLTCNTKNKSIPASKAFLWELNETNICPYAFIYLVLLAQSKHSTNFDFFS